MLQYPLTSNTAKQANYVSPNKDNSKESHIVKRIEELNKWKEEQQKILDDRQNLQRKMLEIEQRNLYGLLGIKNDDFNTSELEEFQEVMEQPLIGDGWRRQKFSPNKQTATTTTDEEPSTYKTLTSGYVSESYSGQPTELGGQSVCVKPKKPFLKRGQGLKQRFKIDPEELKLNNLPKYKYANAHPNLKVKRIPSKQTTNDAVKQYKTKTSAPMANSDNSKQPQGLMDAQEKRFQQLLINSRNINSSTPDTKSSLSSSNKNTPNSTASSSLPKVHFADPLSSEQYNKKDVGKLQPRDEEPLSLSPLKNPCVAWAQVFDNQQIFQQPIPRRTANLPAQTLSQTEEDIFELMEQKANEGSFDMDSSYIKKFMQNKACSRKQDTDNIPVSEQMKMKRLQPDVKEIPIQEDSSYIDDSNEEEQEDTLISETEDQQYAAQSKRENARPSSPPTKHVVKVRFSDSLDTHEYTEESVNTLTDTSAASMSSVASQVGDGGEGDSTKPEYFEEFKKAIFAVLQNKADFSACETTSDDATIAAEEAVTNVNYSIVQQATAELQEKTELIKQRLVELEKEIETFKSNNLELIKAKQQHELEKVLHAQEHLEAIDRIKDERIQMEIYLHDERMKIEDEKRKFEQQLNTRNKSLAAQEQKERQKLREQVAQLEAQLKAKENNHMAAQSRLRAQIRNMEKEQKKLYDEIEELKKANKRLENENLKISREQNNKMLQEINRNIAKLAPKNQDDDDAAELATMGAVNKMLASKHMLSNKKTLQNGTKNVTCPKRQPQLSKKNFNLMPEKSKSVENICKPNSANSDENKKRPAASKQKVTFSENQKIKNVHDYANDNNDEVHGVDDDDDESDVDENFVREYFDYPVNNQRTETDYSMADKQQTSPEEQSTAAATAAAATPATNSSNQAMKREIDNDDGSKDIWYSNGNLKKISADGMMIRMLYFNKDIKETDINEGTVKYYYAESNVWHTTYLDGLEILEFPNGTVEHRHKNGIVEIHYPNNSVKITDPADQNKLEEWRFADGTHLVQLRTGDKILSMPNGQKEIHTKLHKRREYPDGTVKLVYPDGSTETRYSNGRVRLKDNSGKLVLDTEMAK